MSILEYFGKAEEEELLKIIKMAEEMGTKPETVLLYLIANILEKTGAYVYNDLDEINDKMDDVTYKVVNAINDKE